MYVLACVCMLLTFLCAPIKVILHKTSRVLLILFKVRLAARVRFQATITICDKRPCVPPHFTSAITEEVNMQSKF